MQAVDDEPSQKLMIELRRRRYPILGDDRATARPDSRDHDRRHPRLSRPELQPSGTILAVAGNFDWPRLCDHVEPFRRLGASRRYAARSEQRPLDNHIAFDSSQSHVAIAYPTIPYKPRLFSVVGGGRRAVERLQLAAIHRGSRSAAMYTVNASLHTQRDRAACFVTPAPRPNGPRKRST